MRSAASKAISCGVFASHSSSASSMILARSSFSSEKRRAVYDPAGADSFLEKRVFSSFARPFRSPKHPDCSRWQKRPFCLTTNLKASLSQSSEIRISSCVSPDDAPLYQRPRFLLW